jgi:hypothetical protein
MGILFNLFFLSCTESKRQAPSREGDSDWKYFGLSTPGTSPVVFSPDIISTHRNERDFTISPSGHEMFYSLVLPNNTLSVILYLQFDGFFWSEPQVARFSGQWSDLEPAYSPDGSKLFFASKRPYNNQDTIDNWNLWYIEYTNQGWSNAIAVGEPVNTDGNEFYPSITNEGAIYFTATRDDSFGMEDIYVSYLIGGEYSEPVNLGDSINTAGYEYNAYIAPDESFLIFGSFGRKDEYGGGDLYISFRKPDGTWTKSKNMGKGINSDKLDYCPFVTRDQQFLFFTSQRIDPALEISNRKNIGAVLQLADGIENGLGNIYWVSFNKDTWR